MRLKTINESLNESGGYPPGAAGDSRAPFNQPSVDHETSEINATVWDTDGDNELPVKITYEYYEHPDGSMKYITDYSYELLNPNDKDKVSPDVDDDVKAAIEQDAGKCEFE